MSELTQILKYQETDKKLYAIERELASCPERKDYVKAKKFMEAAAEKLDALDARAKQLKSLSADLEKQYDEAEESLKDYANLDELLSQGADVSFYKKNALALSDTLKKIRSDLSALVGDIKSTSDEYKNLKKQVIDMQRQYKDFQEKYAQVKKAKDEEKAVIEKELSALAKGISPEFMERYETKRKEKVFPVLGELNGGTCPFCMMQPPIAAIQKADGGETIECDNCHRILYKTVS